MKHCRKAQDKLSCSTKFSIAPPSFAQFWYDCLPGHKSLGHKKKGERAKTSPSGIAKVVSNWSIKLFLLLPMFVLLISLFFENTETCRRKPNSSHYWCSKNFDANYLAIPTKNINITLHRPSTDGGFYVNISWIHPTGKFDLLVSSSSSSSLSLLEILVSQNLGWGGVGGGHKMSGAERGRELK